MIKENTELIANRVLSKNCIVVSINHRTIEKNIIQREKSQTHLYAIVSRLEIIIDDNYCDYVVHKRYPRNVRKRCHRISQKMCTLLLWV